MNILLWVLQILLALHTAMGAVWKLSNSDKVVASLRGIPRRAWLVISAIELLLSAGLICTAFPSLAILVPIAAACVTVEMLCFIGLHLYKGFAAVRGPMLYWLVVVLLAAGIVYGRLAVG
ncbi:MAG TPA: hypothetical protein VGM16_04955 [Gammaproteobacteria bacterium]|jgi:hypothetical protein